jgi:hypothetical protein
MLFSLKLPCLGPGVASAECNFSVYQILEDVMVAGKVVPRQAETQDTVRLSKAQKVIGVCLLLFYLAMIVITIATLPYVASLDAGALFWQSRNSEY